MSTTVPPQCQRLTLVGKLSWDHVRNLPESLKTLLVMSCVLPEENKISEALAHFPRHLTTLIMLEAFPADAGPVLNFFVDALPTTLTTVSIVANEFRSFGIDAIARLVSRLPSLQSFLLQGRKIMGLDTLVAELPRTSLKQHILRAQKLVELDDEVAGMLGAGGMFAGIGGLGMEDDEEEEERVSLLACVAEKLPTSVKYLELMLPYDNKTIEIAAKVPLATRQLVLFITNWTPAMLAQVPIAPTVERVVLQSGTAMDLSLFLRRLPVSVKDLDLSGFLLNNPDVVTSVARHLPPSLVWLSLKNCRLTTANLARASDDGSQLYVSEMVSLAQLPHLMYLECAVAESTMTTPHLASIQAQLVSLGTVFPALATAKCSVLFFNLLAHTTLPQLRIAHVDVVHGMWSQCAYDITFPTLPELRVLQFDADVAGKIDQRTWTISGMDFWPTTIPRLERLVNRARSTVTFPRDLPEYSHQVDVHL
ncbi:hypothetical protein GGF31_006111 [Allomyces arbusculus]|nr:hypothetical protein GGF31_006111 [Allomyces arbusculus]